MEDLLITRADFTEALRLLAKSERDTEKNRQSLETARDMAEHEAERTVKFDDNHTRTA